MENVEVVFKKQNSEENKISLDRLYEYFKELNSSENEASPDDFSRIYSQNGVDLLNSEITEDEVIKAIKNLKNNISTASRIDYFFISI